MVLYPSCFLVNTLQFCQHFIILLGFKQMRKPDLLEKKKERESQRRVGPISLGYHRVPIRLAPFLTQVINLTM